MKKNNYIPFLFMLLFVFATQAQSKKWTLEECVKYAIENNISIKQTALDTQSAEINKQGAVGSFLPKFSANGSHSWNIGSTTNAITNARENQTTQFTSIGADAGIDIYKGLQNQNNLRKANLSVVVAKYQLQKMQEDISLNVANAFLQVLFNKENLKVQQEQLAINQKQMTRSQELVNAGTIPRGDLLDIKATLVSGNQKVIAAENALLISKLSLSQLLQLKDFETFDVIDDTNAKDEKGILLQTPIAIYDKAKQTRTELKIANTNLKIAEKDVAIAKGNLQPTLTGGYRFNTSAGYSDRFLGLDTNGKPITAGPLPVFDQFNNNKGHNIALSLSIPIFNGFSAKNNVQRSQVSLEKTKIALEQQNQNLERSVYTAFTDAKGAMNAHESAIIALEARQEAYNYAKEKNAVGLMNSFDLNQSQTLFSNAQSEVLRTKYDYIFKIKILEFYFGIPILKN
jgi:outer membrane protein